MYLMQYLLELDYFSTILVPFVMSGHLVTMIGTTAFAILTVTNGQGCYITDEIHIDDTLGRPQNW